MRLCRIVCASAVSFPHWPSLIQVNRCSRTIFSQPGNSTPVLSFRCFSRLFCTGVVHAGMSD